MVYAGEFTVAKENVPLELALSIKQPWTTLILLGLKSIEIRQWSTPLRGRIYLHAGKIADDRPEGWALVPEKHRELTERRGGIVGMVDLVACLTYESARAFARDCQLHRNQASWFAPPRLYGFQLERPALTPFHPWSGQVKFFPVQLPTISPVKAKKTAKIRSAKVVRFEIP